MTTTVVKAVCPTPTPENVMDVDPMLRSRRIAEQQNSIEIRRISGIVGTGGNLAVDLYLIFVLTVYHVK